MCHRETNQEEIQVCFDFLFCRSGHCNRVFAPLLILCADYSFFLLDQVITYSATHGSSVRFYLFLHTTTHNCYSFSLVPLLWMSHTVQC